MIEVVSSMLQVSRDNNLKIPRDVENVEGIVNTIEDRVATKMAFRISEDKKADQEMIRDTIEEQDKGLDRILKIPYNSNDLIVITSVKKLGAYIIAITEKSPKKYRGVFVNRMQNYCLESLECLLQANFIRVDSLDKKKERENYQKEAIIKLKLLGYIAMLAENACCILPRQYKQISIQLSEAMNLTAAWKKSDDERWRKRM